VTTRAKRPCEECGIEFTPRLPDNAFCTPECAQSCRDAIARHRYYREAT
jgi:hypothetical protein